MTHEDFASFDRYRVCIRKRRQFAIDDLLKFISKSNSSDGLDFDYGASTAMDNLRDAVNRDMNFRPWFWMRRLFNRPKSFFLIFHFDYPFL